jgi:membrane associated rhomboid family serine protease
METGIRATPREAEAEEWALVLTAEGIPHRLERGETGWTVVVPDPEARRARAVLDSYEGETRREPAAPLPDAESWRAAWAVGVAAGAFLLAFFAITGHPVPGSRWFERGAASAARMLDGEWWRAVTALTLHLDMAHVAGNAVATVVLVPPIVQRMGPGYAVGLVLLAGAVGNLLAAMVHGPAHVAVGASTATFGAIGILAAFRLRAPTLGRARRKPWLVPVAALVLLAMLGASRGADIVAHALGLVVGAAVGLVAPDPGQHGRPIQWGLAALAVLVVAGCWQLALSAA